MDSSVLASLESKQLFSFMMGLRDLWLSVSWKMYPEGQAAKLSLLNAMMEVVDDNAFPSAELQSLPFSLISTKHRHVLRFIEHLEEAVELYFAECAAQLSIKSPSSMQHIIYAVWIDACDLSYHNFECILPLDCALNRPVTNPKCNQHLALNSCERT
jgi:hypothetical protein